MLEGAEVTQLCLRAHSLQSDHVKTQKNRHPPTGENKPWPGSVSQARLISQLKLVGIVGTLCAFPVHLLLRGKDVPHLDFPAWSGLPFWTEQPMMLLKIPLGLQGQALGAPSLHMADSIGCESDPLGSRPSFLRPTSTKDAAGLVSRTKNLIWAPYSTAGFRVSVSWLCHQL